MRKEIKVAESSIQTAAQGLTAEQVESFKENGFIGPFDLYAEDEAPLVWSQAMIDMVTSENKPHNSTIINYDRHLDCNALSRHIAQPAIVHKLRTCPSQSPAWSAMSSGRPDLNRRPSAPKADALPSCATSRSEVSLLPTCRQQADLGARETRLHKSRTRCLLIPNQAGQPSPSPRIPARPTAWFTAPAGPFHAIHCGVLNNQRRRRTGAGHGWQESNPQRTVLEAAALPG